jgi:hypothetical protein
MHGSEVMTLSIMTRPQKKDKLNLSYLIIGLLFCVSFFWKDKKIIHSHQLETIKIVASHDIQKIGRRKSNDEFRIHPQEYECSFVIKTAGGLAANWDDNLYNITKYDTLTIKIHHSRLSDLNEKSEKIPIYSLIKNSQLIYDTDGYNTAQRTLDRRWNVILIIMSILFILRGLTIISGKTAFILAGCSILILIILRSINVWW